MPSEPRFRPSLHKRVQARLAVLSSQDFLDFNRRKDSPLPLSGTETPALLDAFIDYQNYMRIKFKFNATDLKAPAQPEMETASPVYRDLLAARAQSTVASEAELPVLKPVGRPDEGHLISRVGTDYQSLRGRHALGLYWSPARHDLLDPPRGYLEHSEIEFLTIAVQRLTEERRLRLRELTLARGSALTPADTLNRAPIWTVGAGIFTPDDFDCPGCNLARAYVGLGASVQPMIGILMFGMAKTEVDYGGWLEHAWRLGPVLQGTIASSLTASTRLLLSSETSFFPIQSVAQKFQEKLSLSASQTLWPRLQFRLNSAYHLAGQAQFTELGGGVAYFF